MNTFRRVGLWGGIGAFAVAASLVALRAPLPDGLTPAAVCLIGVTALMALWWISEAVDLAATALVPLVLFPLCGIAGVKDLSGAYSDRFILLLMGGFFIAMSLERWGLHRRLALFVLDRVGAEPRRLVVSFALTTAVLSMWISNTAAALMMLPIAAAVLARLQEGGAEGSKRVGLVLMLGIAYGASVGGLGTPIGTPPNVIFLGQYHRLFPDAPRIGFLQWMVVAVPLVVVFLGAISAYLVRGLPRFGRDAAQAARDVVRSERAELGPMSVPEKRVAWVFGLTAALWIFRVPIPLGDSGLSIPGWSDLLGLGELVDDSTVAIGSALLMFVLPAGGPGRERLLDWPTAVRIPWGLVLLFGGGIAIAVGFGKTGLDAWVGQQMTALAGLPPVLLIACTCLGVTFLTEVTSNTAVTAILVPILGAGAANAGVAPLALMLPATLSASCAFMLPVATAPNAIVFGSGHVTIPEMARVGFAINLIGVVLVTAVVWLLGLRVLG